MERIGYSYSKCLKYALITDFYNYFHFPTNFYVNIINLHNSNKITMRFIKSYIEIT